MAELRHSASMISRAAAASSSPVKRDDDSSAAKLLFSSSSPRSPSPSAIDVDSDVKKDHYRSSSPFLHSRSLLSALSSSHRNFLIGIISFLLFLSVVLLPSLWSRLSAPYLCYKEGITLHCPRVKEAPSLWENPHASTISWKPCAERRGGGVSDRPHENKTTGYIFIHAEGGLNQQRIAQAQGMEPIGAGTPLLGIQPNSRQMEERSRNPWRSVVDLTRVEHRTKSVGPEFPSGQTVWS